MQSIRPDKRDAAPVDAATKAALEAAQEQVRRGETVTLEEAFEYAERKYEEWLKTQQEAIAA